MEFRKVLALRGPSIWANFPVLEAWVDLGELKDRPSNEIPGFNERLMGWMPSMIEHRCSIGQRGGFFQRLRTGTYQAHILEHVTLELQTLAGTEVGFGKARETSEEGVYKVIVEYGDETVGRACLEVARELCLAAVYDRPFDVAGQVRRLRELAQEVCLGPSTRAIVEAAAGQGHPLPPAEQREPGGFRSWAAAAADSGRRDRPDRRHCRVDRPGQGDDPHAACARWACPRPAAGR